MGSQLEQEDRLSGDPHQGGAQTFDQEFHEETTDFEARSGIDGGSPLGPELREELEGEAATWNSTDAASDTPSFSRTFAQDEVGWAGDIVRGPSCHGETHDDQPPIKDMYAAPLSCQHVSTLAAAQSALTAGASISYAFNTRLPRMSLTCFTI